MSQQSKPSARNFRNQFLKICLEKRLSSEEILKLVKPMHGKTDEEKEQMAQELINEIRSL